MRRTDDKGGWGFWSVIPSFCVRVLQVPLKPFMYALGEEDRTLEVKLQDTTKGSIKVPDRPARTPSLVPLSLIPLPSLGSSKSPCAS